MHAENNPWMHHHICTAYGDSHQAAGWHTWNTLIAGIGQSNGAGSPIWEAVSSPMFEIMCQDCFYALLMGAISHQQCQISGFAFIDNTDLCMTHPSNSVDLVVHQMQLSVNHWEGLLWAMGGVLVLEKCFWYLVDFKYNNNKWRYKCCNQAPGEITLLDTCMTSNYNPTTWSLRGLQNTRSPFSSRWQYGNGIVILVGHCQGVAKEDENFATWQEGRHVQSEECSAMENWCTCSWQWHLPKNNAKPLCCPS